MGQKVWLDYTKKFINSECQCHWATSHKTQAGSISFF
jgi:hypothetical protein